MVNTRDFTYAEKLGSTVTYQFAGRIGYGGGVPYGTYVMLVSVASRRAFSVIEKGSVCTPPPPDNRCLDTE
jgi:hypothetical protein